MVDLNNDGWLDITAADHGQGVVAVLLRTPPAASSALQPATTYTAHIQSQSVAVGDVNGHGILDAVVANYGGANVTVLAGSGINAWAFSSGTNYAANANPVDVALGDANQDGKLDILVANSNNVSVLVNSGTGTFGSPASYAAGTNATGMAVGDQNRDGRLDIAVSNWTSNNVSLLLGAFGGTFAALTAYTTGGTQVTGLEMADLNGDGWLDLVASNHAESTVGVRLR
ncbi:MAG TPA: VCBS repeat-containing protein [Roseiflexaceae bacterium]|nr:VCBS repeat-containing protein [Roseiflexaceae bacterium]